MIDWASRVRARLAGSAPRNPADETGETPVLSVLAVVPVHVSRNLACRSGTAKVSAPVPPCHEWIDPVPAGGRDVLSLLDLLGGMTTQELMDGLAWRRGEVFGVVARLRDMGAVRLKGTRWTLAPAAERLTVRGVRTFEPPLAAPLTIQIAPDLLAAE